MTEQKKRKKSLLDDDGDGAGPEAAGIRVNKAYAARFEHNKRLEELHWLQSKYPEQADKFARQFAREKAKAAGEELPCDDVDDSSGYEEEDDGDIPEEVEAKIFDTLLRIRSQDPTIYQKDVQFFKEEDGDELGEQETDGKPGLRATKAAKPLYLKDMIAKQALEYGADGDSSDEDDGGQGGKKDDAKKHNSRVYDHEQEALRKAFLEAAREAENVDGDDGVLPLRSKREVAHGGEDREDGGDDDLGQVPDGNSKSAKKPKKGGKDQSQFQQLVDAYFGAGSDLRSDDKFLKEYIVNKGWVDRDDDYIPSYREVVGNDGEDGGGARVGEDIDDEEDEVHLHKMNAFEAKYNFRYEEPGADRIVTHPRIIEGTVRKPDDKRKRQRDAKKQRLEDRVATAQEEVKRLKNLKKQEMENKLERLRSVAGAAAPASTSLDDMLEGDFDPEKWDKKMSEAFNDGYYAVEEDLGNLKDDLDLLGEDMGDSDDGVDGDGEEMDTVRFRTLQRKLKEVDALSEEQDDAAPDPEVVARQRADLQRLLEEYYKLDYEDNIGGVKTRFRYKEVPASTFGLSVDEILRLDDQKLSQVVGIKRLAPYRDDLAKLRPNYKALELIKGDLAIAKNPRRQYKKRERRKGSGDGRQDGQGRHQAEARGARAEGEAGVGPGSAKTDEVNGKETRANHPEVHRKTKRKPQVAFHGDKAGLGPSSEAAIGEKARFKKRKQSGSSNDGYRGASGLGTKRHKKEEPQKLDPKQARLASYAVPTLKKEPWSDHKAGENKMRNSSGGGREKQDGGAQAQADGLSRAQRKNLKRSQKRASKTLSSG